MCVRALTNTLFDLASVSSTLRTSAAFRVVCAQLCNSTLLGDISPVALGGVDLNKRLHLHYYSSAVTQLTMAVRPTSSQRILLVFASAAFFVANAFAQDNGEFDHRAHAVPGPDQTVYDLNDDGAATVTLDGVGSHSHYFNAGPPVQSGEIVSYEWAITATGETICNKVLCSHEFDVGETQVSLTVVDNTGDIAVDIVIVTVLPFSAATESPRIDSLSPNQGQNTGNNIVTVTGAFLYDDSRVYFGKQEALSVTRESLDKLTCIAPGGSGIVSVTVVSAVGTSNGAQYTFQSSSSIPVNFKFSTWMEKEGDKEFVVEEITSIVVGRDHRYYLGSLTGYVTVATVDRDRRVQDSCQGAFMGKARSITGLGFNPVDPFNRVFATTVTHFHIKKGVRWDNALVETVEVAANGCPVRGKTIISGLPVSNHDHGPSAITFLRDGRLLLSVGSFTNAGVSTPGDGIGGVPENPLSASYVVADYLRPGFNGAIVYDQYTNPATANIVSGDVKTYVDGIRNSFGVVSHSNGQLYATDNGPNNNFGKTSTSCTEQDNDPTTDDKLLRLVEGSFYGHPNRNRGRRDPRQCVFKGPEEAAGDDYVPPLGYMTSSTNGCVGIVCVFFVSVPKDAVL